MAVTSPRFDGWVTGWNDERGFGFITWEGGAKKAFFHISEYRSAERPADGHVVKFTLTTDTEGRPQARHVVGPGPQRQYQRPAGVGSLAPVVLLVAAYFVADQIWFIPAWVAWLYLASSAVAFVAYAFDKAWARAHKRRVSEGTLLFLGFVGGWPGAIVAQLAFRHKTQKQSFRVRFWLTVVANVLLVVVAITLGYYPQLLQ